MAYFCNGKKGICPTYEMDACGDCKYFDGSGGHKIAIQTNADHIRGMTDEELTKWLCSKFDCYGNKPCPAKHECYPDHNGMLCWLQQPYKENEDG